MDNNLTPQRVADMKKAIHEFLTQGNVYSSIREIVDSYVTEHPGRDVDVEDPNEIMKIVKEKGVLQSLLTRLQSETGITQGLRPRPDRTLQIGSENSYLHVRLNGGRAFVDSLGMTDDARKACSMFVAVQFGVERFKSALSPCCTNPDFPDDFVLRLDATPFGFATDELIEISTPFHIAVFVEDNARHTATLIGENMLDWRRVLKTGFLGLTVELCGRNAGVPAGIVDIQLELLSAKKIRYDESDILTRLEKQRDAITAADREFLIYARRWWGEYQGLNRKHRERKVKLFAATTNGRMIPVTHFVSPLQAGYGLTSPLDALRFVSLFKAADQNDEKPVFPLEQTNDASSWLPTFVFTTQRQGHSSNHAALLCSLLLGFGLDAYCAIGLTTQGDVGTFVVTRNRTGSGAIDVTVWDPLLGEKTSVTGAHSFATVDCMFNHRLFFANTQPSNSLTGASFELDNDAFWKVINPLKLRLVPKYPSAPLVYEAVACEEVEKALEIGIRSRIVARRDTIGQLTTFDDNLSYVLSQALDGYESQRRSGRNGDFSMFEQCVKGLLGPGKTFKALPVNMAHEDEQLIFNVLSTNDAGREIIETVALEDVKFGVRVRVFSFPEGVRSVWIMIAASYRIQM